MTADTREVGSTKDVGFQIGVSRTFDIGLAEAWDVLTGAGTVQWLGAPGEQVRWAKGASGVTDDGAGYELRSVRPMDRIRVVATSAGEPETTIQVTVRSTPTGGTSVRFHQERLRDALERSARRDHWRAVLAGLAPLLIR